MKLAGKFGTALNSVAQSMRDVPDLAALPAAAALGAGTSVLGNVISGQTEEGGKPPERVLLEAAAAAALAGGGAALYRNKAAKNAEDLKKNRSRYDLLLAARQVDRKLGANNPSYQGMSPDEIAKIQTKNKTESQELIEKIRNTAGLSNVQSMTAPVAALALGGLGSLAGGGVATLAGVPQTQPINPNTYESGNSDSNLMSYYAATNAMMPSNNIYSYI